MDLTLNTVIAIKSVFLTTNQNRLLQRQSKTVQENRNRAMMGSNTYKKLNTRLRCTILPRYRLRRSINYRQQTPWLLKLLVGIMINILQI